MNHAKLRAIQNVETINRLPSLPQLQSFFDAMRQVGARNIDQPLGRQSGAETFGVADTSRHRFAQFKVVHIVVGLSSHILISMCPADDLRIEVSNLVSIVHRQVLSEYCANLELVRRGHN